MQETHHEIRIPKRDVFISSYLFNYLRLCMDHTQGNLIQLKTFKLELDFAEYLGIQYTDVRIGVFAGLPIPYRSIYRVT